MGDSRGRHLFTIALVCSGLVVTAPALAAAPDTPDAALSAASAVEAAARVPAGWTGAIAGCSVGGESAESLQATQSAVNLLRSAAGLGPVTFEPELNRLALAAALIMAAQNDLSHYPTPEWACYSEDGAEGAGNSNLYLGRSGAAAMLGYVLDDGVSSLGHRRWLLDPAASVFGSGSTGRTNALWVVPEVVAGEVTSGMRVAWPPAGYVPASWLPEVWSLAIGNSTDAVTADSPQVTMTLDGQAVPVSQVEVLPEGFGTGITLSWWPTVDLSGLPQASHRVQVSVSGFELNGAALPISYTVNVVAARAAGQPSAAPTQPVGEQGGSPTPTATATTAAATVQVKATKRRSILRVDVGPDLPGNWRFSVLARY